MELPGDLDRPEVEAGQLFVVATTLRDAGARLRLPARQSCDREPTPRSDTDVAAWFGRPADAWEVPLPETIDLLVPDTAPLELAGRVALHGRLLFEADPAERVAWEATTRKIYLNELPRRNQARRDFVDARRHC